MDDAGAVGGDEHLRDRQRDAQLLAARELPLLYDFLQRLPVDVLEHEQVDVAALDVVMDAADVRVIDLRERARLAQQPLPRLGVEAVLRVQDLQRDFAVQLLVMADVHVSHPALTGNVRNADVTETTSDQLHMFVGPLGPRLRWKIKCSNSGTKCHPRPRVN